MTWLWKEIEEDWLLGSALAQPPEVIVEAFERVEAHFGRPWIEASRMYEGGTGPARGTAPTLNIVTLGRQLAILEHVDNCGKLLKKLRDRDASAYAELSALWLACNSQELEIEYEPQATVSGRTRKSDFRIRRDMELWTYVEVTQPNRSAAQERMHTVMNQLARTIEVTTGSYAAEVYFLRLPELSEVEHVRAALEKEVALSGAHEYPLPEGLGVIYFNTSQPGQVVVDDHGFPRVPRLAEARAVVENGKPVRHIAVRMPYFDSRGNQFLATEAAQLPGVAPDLIMVQTSGAPGALKEWIPVLEDEFQLELYRQVSGVCLFMGGHYLTDRGEEQRIETKLVLNNGAKHQLPVWLQANLHSD
jgi:hypothetical protein